MKSRRQRFSKLIALVLSVAMAITLVLPTATAASTSSEASGVELENLSLNKTITGQHNSNRKNPYENAVDGNHTTCAGPSTAVGSTWFQVDLEKISQIDRIDLYGWGTFNYTIEVSTDGEQYTEAAKSTEAVNEAATVNLDQPLNARYVRVTVARTDSEWQGIGFDVYGSYIEVDVESVTITGGDTVEVGKTLPLTAAVTPDGAESGVSWISSDTTKATVDSTGKVTGIAVGEVTITATSTADETKSATHTVTVNEASGVELENLSLNKTVTGQHASNGRNPYGNAVDGNHSTCAGPSSGVGSIWFQVDLEKVAQITSIDLYGWGIFNYTIEVSTDGKQYSEAAKSTEAVNEAATVTLASPLDGRYVKVTVARADGNRYPGIGFDVYGNYYKVDVQSVTISSDETTVAAGQTLQLTADVTGTPAGAVSGVTWSSSNAAVAAVNAKGVVTGIAAGTATITATSADDPSKSASVEITVITPENPVQLTAEAATVYLKSPVQLQAKVYLPDTFLIWESADPSIATVSENGLVRGITEGTTTVTVKSKANTEHSDTATITVQKRAEEPISGTDGDVSISPSGEITLLPGGDTVQLTVEGINENETVTWTSGDRRFATVQDGLVTSVGVGSTTITAVAGGKTVKARVNVVADTNMITNDTFYVDTDGNPILSQGGGIFKFGGTYYWYGVKYEQAENYSKNPVVSTSSRSNDTTFSAVTCYTSTDLVNWTYEGDVVTRETFRTGEYPDADVSWFGRMGVMYNQKNNNYTLVSQAWVYTTSDKNDPDRDTATTALVFLSCDSPTGNFGNVTYQKSFEGGLKDIPTGATGDQTVFIDDDGTPYLIGSQANGRARQYVCEFDDDYMWIEKVHEVYLGQGREGNCMFKYNGYYYIASSDLHGWNASPAYVLRPKTTDILGKYEMMAEPMNGSVEGYSHVSQTGFFYTVKNGDKETVLFCGDRWSGFGGNGMGFHSWVPLSFELNDDGSAKEIIFNDLSQFYLDESTGDWSVSPFNNYVINPAFEADRVGVSSPMGWVASGGNNVMNSSPFSGRWSWRVTEGGSIKQGIKNIPEGSYTLKLWTKGSGTGYVYINNSDGTELARFAVDGSNNTWTQVMVGTGLELTGTCEIGVVSTSGNVDVDDFTLIKTVGPVGVENVTITGGNTVEVGKTLQLTATVSPAGAESNVNWTSSDTAKATVDSTGKVTGIAAGEVTITATSTADSSKTATHKVTLTITAVAHAVTVQTDGNGTASASPASAEAGEEITLRAEANDGYHFKAWQVISGDVAVSGNKFIMPNCDVTVKAVFEVDPSDAVYTITFDANGGTVDPASGTTGTDGKLSSLPTPTQEGYTFDGWFTAADAGTQVDANYVFSANGTIYAHWSANTPSTYAVTVNGSYATASGAGSYAKNATVTISAGSRSGYNFNGWTVVSGGVTLASAGSATTSFTMPDHDVTVQANWTSTGSSNTGGKPSSGGSTTTTTKNDDGSTTTTKTDRVTGTVTETTKNVDGSQTVVETKKDGTVTETVTDTNGNETKVETKKDGTVTTTETDTEGNKAETVSKPDGSSVTTVEQKNGTTATVNTDTEGKVEAEVALPKEVVAAAQEESTPIALPIPQVKVASTSTDAAPAVTVKTGSEKPVKVLIPTTETKPGTVAVIVKEDGTEEIIKTSVSTENGLAVSLPDGAKVKIVDNSKSFDDVPEANWAADAVSFSSARELFAGTSETTFSPEQPMTRAMMVTVLARFDGADTSGGIAWYEQGVNWAVENGISDGSNPNANISREQLVVMLWRYAGSPASSGNLNGFHDAGSVSNYAQEAMRWAVENGIVNGMGDNRLVPQGQATRAQVAQMLKNFIENQPN